jgi:hypothetical protein
LFFAAEALDIIATLQLAAQQLSSILLPLLLLQNSRRAKARPFQAACSCTWLIPQQVIIAAHHVRLQVKSELQQALFQMLGTLQVLLARLLLRLQAWQCQLCQLTAS